MVLAATTSASVSLQVRAGKSLSIAIVVYDETTDNIEVNLSSYEGRLQIRDLRGRGRVLLDAKESLSSSGALQRTSNGGWLMFLGKSYTSWLPFLSRVEVEIQNKFVPDDVLPLFSGTLSITPEAVTNA